MTITMMKMIKFWDIGFDSSIALESALSGCNRTPVPKENEKQLSVPKRHWLCALGAAVSRLFFTSRSNFDFFSQHLTFRAWVRVLSKTKIVMQSRLCKNVRMSSIANQFWIIKNKNCSEILRNHKFTLLKKQNCARVKKCALKYCIEFWIVSRIISRFSVYSYIIFIYAFEDTPAVSAYARTQNLARLLSDSYWNYRLSQNA